MLQFGYNFCLSLSRSLLPQSEYTFCLSLRVCGQLLIRSILVPLFNFEVPLKKIIKKKLQQKNRKKQKEPKKQHQRRGFVCVFLSFVWWCFVITFVSRLASLA
jgi:Na+/H+ antiporter NhaD/arsenite permease-like protein